MVRGVKKSIVISVVMGVLVFAVAGCRSAGDDAGTAEVQSEVTVQNEAAIEVVVEDTQEAEVEAEVATEAESESTTEVEAEVNDMFQDTGISTFELSSEDLHDGVWDSIITNTDNGSNVSPQLAWEPVPDAGCYVILMVDTTVQDWIHWKSNNVTETNLPQGWAPQDEYIGPYPPGGTHDYEIYVFALKEPVERVKGAFNNSNMKFKANALALDEVTEGASGNIIAYGHITGTYTKED